MLLRVRSHLLGLQIQDFLFLEMQHLLIISIKGNAVNYLLKVHSHLVLPLATVGIAKKGILPKFFVKFPLTFASLSLRAQCEWNLSFLPLKKTSGRARISPGGGVMGIFTGEVYHVDVLDL